MKEGSFGGLEMNIDTKSIYVTQFSEQSREFWICRCTISNFGIPLFGMETREAAESFGRKIAEFLGVAFYASKAKDLWSESTEVPFCSFTTFRVTKTLSDECGLYVEEDQFGRRRLLFASDNPDEIKKYAFEMSKLFSVPVKVDAEIKYRKSESISNGGGEKMAKEEKVNKTKLCQELLAQNIPDNEIINQLTAAHISEGKDPKYAANRAKVFLKYMKGKVGSNSTSERKKVAAKTSYEQAVQTGEAFVEE